MFQILKNRFEQGYKTTAYPKEPISLYSRYRGRPTVNWQAPQDLIDRGIAACPQNVFSTKTQKMDLGRCTFCGACEQASSGQFVRFSQNFELAAANREDLLIDGEYSADLANHAKQHFKKLFGRSLQLRQVSAGGCNSCEADTNVLTTPFFDLSRFGIDFVASPRHADGIHVTGPVTRNMKAALLATYEAVPEPKVVIASGSCAISGGPFYGSLEIVGPVDSLLPVDLFIPGCPPHPLTTLHALLTFFK